LAAAVESVQTAARPDSDGAEQKSVPCEIGLGLDSRSSDLRV